ncbi:MAG: hypothetical protein MUE94_06975 [Verrucomicrobia bacterium]|nr:hypothetical protein [Verrucomicrobiota bacterium]
MNNRQLELGLAQNTLRITVRRARPHRARWWFQQMRQAVDSAIDWHSQPPGRPEQIQLIPGRRPSLA